MPARSLVVRAQAGTLIGIPVATCALVTDVALLIWRYASGIPPLRHDLLGHGALAVMSIAVLWIALRAWRRARGPGGSSISPRITRLVPLLVAIGGAGGLFVGNAWGHDAVGLDRAGSTAICEQLLPAGPHGDPAPAALASCIDVALGCRETAAAVERASQSHVTGNVGSGGAWFACVKSRVRTAP